MTERRRKHYQFSISPISTASNILNFPPDNISPVDLFNRISPQWAERRVMKVLHIIRLYQQWKLRATQPTPPRREIFYKIMEVNVADYSPWRNIYFYDVWAVGISWTRTTPVVQWRISKVTCWKRYRTEGSSREKSLKEHSYFIVKYVTKASFCKANDWKS